MRNSKKLGFLISVVLDEGRPTMRNSLMRLGAGCLFFLRWSYLGSLVVCLLKKAAAGGLDGWGWREFKVLPVSCFDGLARILSCVEDFGVWPDGLLDAYIAMIPKVDGDVTPLGQRPLGVLPVVYRIWASARMGQLEGWFRSWVPDSVFSAGGVAALLKLGIPLLLISRRVFLGLLMLMFTFLLLMLLSLLIRLIEVSWIWS